MPVTNSTAPGTIMASRQLRNLPTPSIRRAEKISGMTICVTPPPRLPHPAVVALAVPTQLGANIIEVWYWVTTNDAPMAPMASRKSRNDS